MILRNYQLDTIQKARDSIQKGNRRIIIQANCGAGKTIIAGSIIESALGKGKKVVFLVHYRQLAYQALQRFSEFGLGDEVGVIMSGEETHLSRPVQIISIQTYEKRLKLDKEENGKWFREADIVFYDECFTAGTHVDGVKIEKLKIGDYVNSYNEQNKVIEKKKITNVFKSKPKTLCKVIINNGSALTCTEKHPFYSKGKYLTANSLSCNSVVSCITELPVVKEKRHEDYDGKMRYLRKGCFVFRKKTIQNVIAGFLQRTSALFRSMCKGEKKKALCETREKIGGFQQQVCFGQDEKEKSYVEQNHYRKDDGHKKGKRNIKCLPFGSWWQWLSLTFFPTNNGSVSWMGNGSICKDDGFEFERKNSIFLQNRYRESKIKNRDRNRRANSLWKTKEIRQKKDYVLRDVGVEDIEIYKQTSDGRFGGMCKDGFVYNLEVEDNNNYFAEGVLVHNCHSSIAKTRKAILDLYKDTSILIGLTATPCRADSRPLGAIYDDIVTCSGISELTELGHLVPAIYYGASKLPDLKNLGVVAGDYNQKELGKRVDKKKLVGDILDNFLRIASDRQTVCFATNVKHSQHIKAEFEKNGISIEHVDAHTPEIERQDILKRFENGDIQVITNVGVFCEGADFPWASCVILAKPSKSYGRFIQMAGRGIRPYPDKTDCILIDHAGLILEHGMLDEPVTWSLDGKEKAWKKAAKRKEKPPLTCDQCQYVFRGKVCPKCGFEVKNYGKKIEVVEAELQLMGKNKKPKPTMADKKRFYGQLEYIRRMKHYEKGWIYHKYLAKFKVAPHHSLKETPPIQPDAKFFNWITYQNIKFAKSKRAHAG